MITKWAVCYEGLRHITEVCQSMQSGTLGKTTVCFESVFEINYAEASLLISSNSFIISFHKVVFAYVSKEKQFCYSFQNQNQISDFVDYKVLEWVMMKSFITFYFCFTNPHICEVTKSIESFLESDLCY